MKGSCFFFEQKTAYEVEYGLVVSEMCIRDRILPVGLVGVGPAGGVKEDIVSDAASDEGFFDTGFNIKSYIRQPLFLFETTPAFKLLDLFREQKIHYALITDEYGSIKGFVTMDDVLDALVGDITQDHQTEYSIAKRETGGNYCLMKKWSAVKTKTK